MTIKSILAVSVLALSAVVLASAEDFTLSQAASIGSQKFKVGTYSVSVKKDQAVFTNPDGKTFKLPVKIEQADKKFVSTMVNVSTGGALTEIDLGGSTTKLMFGQ